VSALADFRARKDEFYRRGQDSPLDRLQRKLFQGLAYFPENPELVVVAALEEPENPGDVTLETSTGDSQTYRRAGVVHFTVDGEASQITLFQSNHDEQFFVPFRDATSGQDTYGSGRYLEVDPARDGHVVVDFNYAYNPYCAYNAQWSCPLPPVENWLAVPIRAGEKDFTGRGEH
jgi:uncharacterized protein (DUF1684 family)